MSLSQDRICYPILHPTVPSVLCFRSGMVTDSIKSRFRTDKAAAPQDQLPQSWLSHDQLSHDQLSQSPLSETQVPKAEKLPKE